MTLYKIGFTGTRQGMSLHQKKWLEGFIRKYGPDIEFHHGDCVGADGEAHQIVAPHISSIVIHPPTDRRFRAFCKTLPSWGGRSVLVLPAKPYLERNKDIVDPVDVLLATPRTDHELRRSGTWYTVRYARSINRLVGVVPR